MVDLNAFLFENYANGQNTYMCCDYNLDLLKIHSVPFSENHFDNILSSGYIPTITLPTRLSDNSTLIYNIFTSNLSSDIFSCILNNHISDLQPIVIFSNDDLPPTKHKYITNKSTLMRLKHYFVLHLKTNIL